MNEEPVIGLYPLNDCILVELKQSRKNLNVKEGKYDSRTEGIVIRIPDRYLSKEGNTTTTFVTSSPNMKSLPNMPLKALIGKRIHFDEYKEGARIKRDGKIYSFIKIEDIRGYETDEQTS